MPEETAIIVQEVLAEMGSPNFVDPHRLVHLVRDRFNTRGIAYPTFSFSDLRAYLPPGVRVSGEHEWAFDA